jgi:hypothetical protein
LGRNDEEAIFCVGWNAGGKLRIRMPERRFDAVQEEKMVSKLGNPRRERLFPQLSGDVSRKPSFFFFFFS